ncbi:MAG: NUDIX hydrolase [Deltaproteobacteria bacterium]|nr:MAG: NUDIX hydrolase [Deltaproteobacteria bacterium]
MTRDYPDRPIVGVAAVVIEDDRVVLVRRGRPPAYGEWSLPGGAVESGETLEEAVVREVAEEIGFNVEVVELVAVLDRIFWDQEGGVQYHYVLMDFLCRKIGGKLQASSDAISCSQVPFPALAQYNLTEETRGVISKAYQRLSGGSPPIYAVKKATSIQS